MVKAFDDIKKEILEFLFERYMEDASARHPLTTLLAPYEVSVADFTFILTQDELIEEGIDGQVLPAYGITVKGINEVEPDYFPDRLATVMNELGLGNLEWVSIREATGIHDIKRVQDIGTVLGMTDFFEIEARVTDVAAKLTPKGRAYFEEHRKEFV